MPDTIDAIQENVAKPKYDWLEGRIPSELFERACQGVYLRENPYPPASIVGDYEANRFVSKSMKIVAMGSCFAQELASWLDVSGYRRLPHHWGVIYNPASARQIVQYSVEPQSWKPQELMWQDSSGFYDPYRKSDDHKGPYFLGQNAQVAESALIKHWSASRETLREAELVVLTLGLTELWRHCMDQKSFFAVPPKQFYSSEIHEFYNLTYADVSGHLDYITSRLRKLNPSVRILLTVSPIPLSISFRPELGPYVATQFSKSVLHASVLEFVQRTPGVFYMPSYEIAMSDRRRFFKPDGRHVNPECVSTIMQAFEHLFVLKS